MIRIPVYEPALLGNEKKYVLNCLKTNWISSKGEYIKKFEDSFSEKIKIKYSSSVSNGTVALHLCMLALGIGPDDEVLVPTLTYIASVNSIKYVGATPIFIDSDSQSWQLDAQDLKKKITKKTKAILVVHLYGHPAEMDLIIKIASENNLYVIEDCAEAFGTYYKGKHVGTFGDMATFSFFGNKTITTGEGGMVVTNDKTLFNRTQRFKGQGLAEHRQYWHDLVGYNYRMTNICAAIGLAQLEQSEVILKRKREVYLQYIKYLKGTPVVLFGEYGDVINSFWMINILIDDESKRDPLRDYLLQHGIETRPVFYPVHTMPIYSDKYIRNPEAEKIASKGVTLPSYPNLKEEQIKEVCELINKFLIQ